MVAGSLMAAGYYMGDDLMPPTASNPKGYYESFAVETINEDLLELAERQCPPNPLRAFIERRPRLKRLLYKQRPLKRYFIQPIHKQRWLSILPVDVPLACPDGISTRIKQQTRRQPYCFKDPRFCYTLPAWRPHLSDTVYLCVFRHPAVTAASIVKNCQEELYLHNLPMTFAYAVRVWTAMYRHILERHCDQGEWLFVHANQLFEATGMERLEQFVGARLDRLFPDAKLQHSTAEHGVPWASRRIYARLCTLAGYKNDGRRAREPRR